VSSSSRRHKWLSRRSSNLLVLALALSIAVIGWSLQTGTNYQPGANQQDSQALSQLAFVSRWQPMAEDWRLVSQLQPQTYGPFGSEFGLEQYAAEAAIGAFLAMSDPTGSVIDLQGHPLMADRVAIGLEQLQISFTRSVAPDDFGDYGTLVTLNPDETQPMLSNAYSEAAAVRLATIVELSGSTQGRLAGPSISAQVGKLTAELGLETVLIDGETWIAGLAEVKILAGFRFVNPANVPVLGAVEPAEQSEPALGIVGLAAGYWRLGVTGQLPESIAPPWQGRPVDGETPIGWTNAESQSYQAENVSFGPKQVRIVTEPADTPHVLSLPFTSGMLVSDALLGWGTTTVELELPDEPGLWPAVWLLDAEACDAPGICSGYNTDTYHEIDLIETRTQEPEVAHLSVHWGEDGATRSSSQTSLIQPRNQSVVVQLERRPGLLMWRIDGDIALVVGGHVSTFDTGPHRSRPMRLVLNTAVGGSFAGEELIGRYGQWWGDSRTPQDFPNLSWRQAELRINSVSHRVLGAPATT
jgi:hypothetical protein